MSLRSVHSALYRDVRRGASEIEYILILALIALAAIVALPTFGSKVSCMFQRDATVTTNITSGGYASPTSCSDGSPIWTNSGTQTALYAMAVGTDGSAYNVAIPAAITSDSSTPTYAMVGGTLPNGLNFSPATGRISGTPSSTPGSPGLTSTIAVQATDGQGRTSIVSYLSVPINGHIVFSFTGSNQNFSLPVASVTFKMWGAGGGGSQDTTSHGGGGGYTVGTLTQSVGQSVTVMVGGGGPYGLGTPAYGGGGGKSGSVSKGGGQGGGRSAILGSGSDLLVAGAGGGAGYSPGNNLTSGAGGGTVGGSSPLSSSTATDSATGGTQTAGGSPTSTGTGYNASMVGSIDQGGMGVAYDDGGNGSGGGGYYGGGAGSDYGNGGGGGGSSYLGQATGASTQAANGYTPSNTSDPDYVTGVGVGNTNRQTGGNGLVIATWPP